LDRLALLSRGSLVDVVESTALALIEDSGSAKSKGTVGACGETGIVDVAWLTWGGIVLELVVVANNVSLSALGVGKDTTLKGADKSSRSTASITLTGLAKL